MQTKFEIIEVVCPRCGNKKSYKKFMEGVGEYGECTSCGDLTYCKEIKNIYNPQVYETPKVECPYCHSTDTKKISTMSKVGNVALFGIFAAGKVSKQWHCNNCKSDF